MANIIFITGGQRSGKSAYAQKLALEKSKHPVYLATARIWDDEFRQRVERHQADRGEEWENIEEEKQLSRPDFTGKTVLVDCLTLWATNFFFDNKADVQLSLDQMKEELEKLMLQQAYLILVSNEIGLGGTPADELQRKFTDLMGWLNQYVAEKAEAVVWMVSGIPVQIKG
ncbi:bifunctional adenosylcobinamide kinase/adenosylcobinamide-phosphate guanylyltransferase [Parabacteroides sp. OttesenSCG-928-G07]|nr:bifunctional adenosylcobinamide kinase/adenosylcobinamide-phosphate guanylyltransferase [Parabacteroides sp. OttesenSCG-928-G07]